MDQAFVLALSIGMEVVKLFGARQRGETLTDEQRHLLDLALNSSFYKLAEACGHSSDLVPPPVTPAG